MSAQNGENRDGNRENRYATSPVNGAKIPVGAHEKNTGGKKGRSGALPSAFRAACARDVTAVRPMLKRIVRGKLDGFTGADRLRAFEMLARYGVGQRQDLIHVNDVRERMQRTLDTLREYLPEDLAQGVVDRIRSYWRIT